MLKVTKADIVHLIVGKESSQWIIAVLICHRVANLANALNQLWLGIEDVDQAGDQKEILEVQNCGEFLGLVSACKNTSREMSSIVGEV